MNDDELIVTKNSVPLLVPKGLVEDCQVNLLDYLRNPHLRPPVKIPTRRDRLFDAWTGWRVRVAERLFKFVAGEDPYDVYWHED